MIYDLFIHLFIHLFIYLLIYLFIYIFLFIYSFIHLFIYLFTYLYIHRNPLLEHDWNYFQPKLKNPFHIREEDIPKVSATSLIECTNTVPVLLN
jgi:hypothetical protein